MADPYDWAVRFENTAKEAILASDFKPLIHRPVYRLSRRCPPSCVAALPCPSGSVAQIGYSHAR
jgi:hypothetical protein